MGNRAVITTEKNFENNGVGFIFIGTEVMIA